MRDAYVGVFGVGATNGSADQLAECPLCPEGHLQRDTKPDCHRCDRCRAFFRGSIPESWRGRGGA